MGARTTREIAQFICQTTYQSLPSEVVGYAKILALSHLGQNIGGAAMDFGRRVNQYIKGKATHSEAGVFGASFGTCVDYAALANGNAAHATELEDNNPESMYSVGHWPTIFAMGEKLKLPGDEVIAAAIIGYEVTSKLGVAFKAAHAKGRQNATCCTIGNAASAAKMLRLTQEQTAVALSLAASQVAGIRRQAGSGAHVVEAGFAGRNGVCAAELAALGYTAQADIFEGKRRFGDIWAECPEFDLPLGENYGLMGVGIRKYSCCNPARRYIEGIFELIAGHDIEWDDIASVEHGIHHTRLHSFRYDQPQTPEQARFSLPHITVACFFDNNVFLPSFTHEKLQNPRWREARKKVKTAVDRESPEGSKFNPSVTITMNDGKRYQNIRNDPEGSMVRHRVDDAMKKYYDCVDFAGTFSRARAEQIAEMTLGLDKLEDISALTRPLTYPDLT